MTSEITFNMFKAMVYIPAISIINHDCVDSLPRAKLGDRKTNLTGAREPLSV